MPRANAVIRRVGLGPRPLTHLLFPETADEQRVLDHLAQPDTTLLSAMVERALRREFHAGAEVGRREVEEESG